MTFYQQRDNGASKSRVNGSTVRSVVLWSLITVIVVTVFTLLAYQYAEKFQSSEEISTATSGMAELLALRRAEDSVLTTYQLVDKEQKIYRIPIERAMELIASESAKNVSTR